MKYQLVLQFAANNTEDFNRLVALEENMRTHLETSLDILVDGHDFGMGEFNIFIHTDDAAASLERVGELIENDGPGLSFAAGYRKLGADGYVALWPHSLEHFRVA